MYKTIFFCVTVLVFEAGLSRFDVVVKILYDDMKENREVFTVHLRPDRNMVAEVRVSSVYMEKFKVMWSGFSQYHGQGHSPCSSDKLGIIWNQSQHLYMMHYYLQDLHELNTYIFC